MTISLAGLQISASQLLKLLQFNMRLMRKCGKNLEFCVIKDNGLDESLASSEMKFLEKEEEGDLMKGFEESWENGVNVDGELLDGEDEAGE